MLSNVTRVIRDTVLFTSAKDAGDPANPYWRQRAPAHWIYVFVMLTLMGVGLGVVSLFVCSSYGEIIGWELFLSYFDSAVIAALNIVPCLILIYFLYFVTGRAWSAFALGGALILTLSLVQYYKVRLRSDPFKAADIALAGEAANMVATRYTLELTGRVWAAIIAFAAGVVFAVFLMPGSLKSARARITGAVVCALLLTGCSALYLRGDFYNANCNDSPRIEVKQWDDADQFVSRGFIYPFIHSFRDLTYRRPAGYSEADAAQALAAVGSDDIPEGQKVNIITIMLESCCDLSVYDGVRLTRDVFAPLHALQAEGVSGVLVDNIFAGGTVDTERCFLTGFSELGPLNHATESYIRYFRSQGYYTEGYHAGDDWFYNRRNVNEYLGYDRYLFLDDVGGADRTDRSFFAVIADMYASRDVTVPYFAYHLSYQNHGPYYTNWTVDEQFVSREGLTDEAYCAVNNYLYGCSDTLTRLSAFIDTLRDDDAPVVVVFFGDHKPWMGDNEAFYPMLGINIDVSTEEGFCNYYSTPYVIWANDAAKSVLGRDFTGEGADMSPCFLMGEVFDLCGWGGSAFMKEGRALRQSVDVINTGSGLFRENGELVKTLSPQGKAAFDRFRRIEYYVQTRVAG